jgi:glucokinase
VARIALNPARAPALAIDLGGTQIRAAVIDGGGKIINREAMPTPAAEGPTAVIAALVETGMRAKGKMTISGVGLASPGPLNTRTRIALGLPTIKGFDDFALGETLDAHFGQTVRVENDAIAAAIGEWRFGAGRGCDDLVYITVSTGIGGGVIAGGRALRGRSGMAGHLGHMAIEQNGEACLCGRKGCWEAYASGYAIARRTGRTAADVFKAARAGEAAALAHAAAEARYLGIGIVSLLHAFDPERIIIGGGIADAFDLLHDGITATITTDAMPAFRDVPVVKAENAGNSGLLGAAALVFDQSLRPD